MDVDVSLPFDRVADRYDASRGGTARGTRMVSGIIDRLAPGRVLEIGVGTGVIAAALREHGVTTHGVDLSIAMLSRARDRLGPRVVRADAFALPVASGAVDNVLFVAALHAIGDAHRAMAEAARVLRPGGRLVAVHGPPRREPAQDDIADAMAPLAVLRNARVDSPATLDDAAAAAGLTPVDTGWLPPHRFGETPAAVADGITDRLWSYLWRIDDSTWRSVVEPVIARLRALPEPGRLRPYELSYRVAAYALTG